MTPERTERTERTAERTERTERSIEHSFCSATTLPPIYPPGPRRRAGVCDGAGDVLNRPVVTY